MSRDDEPQPVDRARAEAHSLVDELIDRHGRAAAVHILLHLMMKQRDWEGLNRG